MKPLCIELFAGMFGWGIGFVAEGYRVIGFDIVHEDFHGPVPEGCSLVLQNVLTLHGSQLRDAACIVASPPCQAYSYRAMPWKRAKALPPPSNELFDACFRIQREASEAAGHHIPMVVENVKGAQPWVGRAKWHYGSYFLWGDVPALMPWGSCGKTPPGNGKGAPKWCDRPVQRLCDSPGDTKNSGGSWFAIGSPGQKEVGQNPVHEGVKQAGHSGRKWFADPDVAGHFSSKSNSRKAASAQIAKIPFRLAQHIARVFKPEGI